METPVFVRDKIMITELNELKPFKSLLEIIEDLAGLIGTDQDSRS